MVNIQELTLCVFLQEKMKARHVLLTTDGAHCDNILKIKPPMVFSCRDADRLVAELEVRLPVLKQAVDWQLPSARTLL